MTAYSMTMSSAVRCFGGAPTDKWAAYNWNAFKWGQGTATITQTVRMAVNQTNLSVASTQAVDFRLVKLLTAQTMPMADAISKYVYRTLSETFLSSSAVRHLYIQDRNNFFRVYPEQVTDLTLRTTPSWSHGPSVPVAWATAAAGNTTWS